MRAILFLVLLVAISWTLLDVVDSKGVPAKRVKRQYYGGYGGYGYGGGCNCPTYAPCPHGGYYGGYGGGYGGYGGYGYKK
ncbi:unnamed protein product [Caenorhabditis sp. 36 PRJEB53466]|nr:unnamed protein product [Caenorhabditis sp. 36 PRJEB53466]